MLLGISRTLLMDILPRMTDRVKSSQIVFSCLVEHTYHPGYSTFWHCAFWSPYPEVNVTKTDENLGDATSSEVFWAKLVGKLRRKKTRSKNIFDLDLWPRGQSHKNGWDLIAATYCMRFWAKLVDKRKKSDTRQEIFGDL